LPFLASLFTLLSFREATLHIALRLKTTVYLKIFLLFSKRAI
jgi:hypothetical protein